MSKEVVVSWSGGIDSTGVVACLLRAGYTVHLVTLRIYGGAFGQRESEARAHLFPILERVARQGGKIGSHLTLDAQWLWAFSPDGIEIPRRNKHILDHLVTNHCMAQKITNVAMGEYIGADTWVVKDHVGAADADHRSLAAYLYYEYGIGYRFFSLADFGESRYKVDRVRILVDAIGGDEAFLTSNCLYDYDAHCGQCYKCIERAAAFDALLGFDGTVYLNNPRITEAYAIYKRQMAGEDMNMSWSEFETHMPHRALKS